MNAKKQAPDASKEGAAADIRTLPYISHPDVCDYEDVRNSGFGANLTGVEETDFDPVDIDCAG